MHVLLVNPQDNALPAQATEALRGGSWEVTQTQNYAEALRQADGDTIDVIVMPRPVGDASRPASSDFVHLMQLIDARRIATLLVGDKQPGCDGGYRFGDEAHTTVDTLTDAVSGDELRGRVAMIERYHKRFRRMEEEVRNMERLGKRLNDHFRGLDQEMQVAARLQRDFLPDVREPIGNLRFATVFRPASWVSGDIYDVFPINDRQTAVFIADAVGHGVAAGLLTMFIKRIVRAGQDQEHRSEPQSQQALSADPSRIMAMLNEALTAQKLPNCQFVTACYGVIDHETMVFRFARGGHPYPLLITSDGITQEPQTSGALLGLYEDEEFPTTETQLRGGDKLLLYTDGIEFALGGGQRPCEPGGYIDCLRRLHELPIGDMFRQLESTLDAEMDEDSPRDDLTILGIEVESAGGSYPPR